MLRRGRTTHHRPNCGYVAGIPRPARGPAGLASIAAGLGDSPRNVQYAVESFLVRQDYVQVVRQGRRITDLGMRYLREARA